MLAKRFSLCLASVVRDRKNKRPPPAAFDFRRRAARRGGRAVCSRTSAGNRGGGSARVGLRGRRSPPARRVGLTGGSRSPCRRPRGPARSPSAASPWRARWPSGTSGRAGPAAFPPGAARTGVTAHRLARHRAAAVVFLSMTCPPSRDGAGCLREAGCSAPDDPGDVPLRIRMCRARMSASAPFGALAACRGSFAAAARHLTIRGNAGSPGSGTPPCPVTRRDREPLQAASRARRPRGPPRWKAPAGGRIARSGHARRAPVTGGRPATGGPVAHASRHSAKVAA